MKFYAEMWAGIIKMSRKFLWIRKKDFGNAKYIQCKLLLECVVCNIGFSNWAQSSVLNDENRDSVSYDELSQEEAEAEEFAKNMFLFD